jgi:ribulose 1,5-bisphosphate synthetase/thiazole synthase
MLVCWPAAAEDLVIYGGTPAGISAGIVAAREGVSVLIIEPTKWIGGMVTGGLSRTDVGNEKTIGGIAREFFARTAVAKPETPMWYAEPSVNMATFYAMLKDAGVRLITEQALKSDRRKRASAYHEPHDERWHDTSWLHVH